jgi:hypothetical protein
MKYVGFFICSFCLFIIRFGASGQLRQIEHGDRAANLRNYREAITFYLEALEKSPYDYQLFKKLGECYRLSGDREEALSYYEKCMITGKFHKDDSIQYARLMLYSGKLEKASAIVAELLQRSPDDNEPKRMADCCSFAVNQLLRSNLPLINNVEMLNSPQSEYATAFFRDSLVFASTRLNRDFLSIDKPNEEGSSEFYITFPDPESQKFTKPTRINNNLSTISGKDAFTFSPEAGLALFSGYDQDSAKSRIYQARLKGKRWVDIKPVNIGVSGCNDMHPSLSADGKNLFFISDRPGGYGGNDVWKSILSVTGTWTEPVNPGPAINTDKDEVYPFISGDSLLFFSSEGHTGMGGLDIFAAGIRNNKFENPVNIGAPFNSTCDDFGIILTDKGSGGYFCSDRIHERKDDIFEFNILTIPVAGKISGETKELIRDSMNTTVEVAAEKDSISQPAPQTSRKNEVRTFIPVTITESDTLNSDVNPVDTATVHFRIQIVASTQLADPVKQFSSISDIIAMYGLSVEKVKKVYKYRIGNFTDEKEALALQQILRKRGYRDCFPVILK